MLVVRSGACWVAGAEFEEERGLFPPPSEGRPVDGATDGRVVVGAGRTGFGGAEPLVGLGLLRGGKPGGLHPGQRDID